MSGREKAKAAGKKKGLSELEARAAVRSRYARLAQHEASCCGPEQPKMCSCGAIYPQAEIKSLPDAATAVSAGCGNPGAIAGLRPGMSVVDLGSGGGIDVFLAAKKVGPKGKIIGVDATPEMIARARKVASENGYSNVEFRLGEIEHMPVESGTADVVISNCVINLSPDKAQVFREAFRVLKPGGRLAVSDIVLLGELPEDVRTDPVAWSSCVAGAVSEAEYVGAMRRAGFTKIKVEERKVYTHEELTGSLGDERPSSHTKDGRRRPDLSGLVASCSISATKPGN